jgi:hypothetical protein
MTMTELTDRLAHKIAMPFDGLLAINIGPCPKDDVPYWVIVNAIAFDRTESGDLVMLSPGDGWYSAHALPHHVVNRAKQGPFGKVSVVNTPTAADWLVVGWASDFNPHFWEPSVVPATR